MQADTLETFTKEVSTAYAVQKIEPLIARQINGENLGEVLQFMTPNFIKRNGPGGIASISIRGGSAWQSQLYWEGIAINSSTLGQSDLSLLPSEFFTTVDLNYSGASSQLGMGGIAGSVSMGSSGFYSYGGGVSFSKEIGSFGLDNTSGKATFAYDSKLFSETIILKKEAVNDFSYADYSQPNSPVIDRKNGRFQQLGFQENLQLKTKLGNIKWITNYLDTDRGVPVAIGVQEQNQHQTDKNLKSTVQLKTRKNIHDEDGSYRVFNHQFNLGFVHDYQNYLNPIADLNTKFNNYTYSGQVHSNFELKRQFTLSTQLNEYFYQAHSDGFDEVVFQNRLSATVIGKKKWDNALISLTLQELFIDDKLSPLIANLGASLDFHTGKYAHRFFGNAGTNYRYPTLNDLYWNPGGNLNLNPEEAINLEVGLRNASKYTNQFFEYSIAYFHDEITNWIQWIPNETGIWAPENVKSVQKSGFEFSTIFRFKMKSSNYILLSSSYRNVSATVKESIVSDNEIGKQLIYTPNQILNLDITLKLKALMLRYNQTITDKFYLDRENTTYLPYSAPANFAIEYQYKEDDTKNISYLSVGVTIHNLWDEAYQIVGNQPMPGRWFSIQLKYHLQNNTFGKKDK